MEAQNNFFDEEVQEPIKSSQLSYISYSKQKEKSVSKAANNSSQERAQSEHI